MKNFDYNLYYLAFLTQFDHCANKLHDNNCQTAEFGKSNYRQQTYIDSPLSLVVTCETAGSTVEWD